MLELVVTADSGERAGAGSPLRLVLADGTRSNAVFPCERAALEATLRTTTHGDEKLKRIGDLDLEDEELEQLLHELKSALVIDQRSLWQLTGRQERPGDAESEDELRLAYADIDYELLRSHPKLRQYLRPDEARGATRSRLQIVLNSITSAFADLLEPDDASAVTAATATAAIADGASSPTATAAEAEDEDEETPWSWWSAQARINVLLRNFIRRFLTGLASTTFQEIAGPHVVAQNYVVFLHFLARLGDRDWIDPRFMLDATAKTVELFWGDERRDGYVVRLDESERVEVLQLIRETHSDAQLLAALYQYAVESRLQGLEESRCRARDTWTGLLRRGTFAVTADALVEARVMLRGFSPPHGPSPAELIDELRSLADFRTRRELATSVAKRLSLPLSRCWFTREQIRRRDRTLVVDCLTVEDDRATLSVEDAQWILASWMRIEQFPHHRVAVRTADGRRPRYVAFYEPADRRGKYSQLEARTPPIDLSGLPLPPSPWDDAVLELMATANEAAERPLLDAG